MRNILCRRILESLHPGNEPASPTRRPIASTVPSFWSLGGRFQSQALSGVLVLLASVIIGLSGCKRDLADIYWENPGPTNVDSGAPVYLESVHVGTVAEVRHTGGRQVAHLRIKREYISQLPPQDRFVVEPFDKPNPGSMGVRMSTQTWPLSNPPRVEQLPVQDLIDPDPSLVPPQGSSRLLLTVLMAILAILLFFALVRLLSKNIVILAIFLLIVGLLLYLTNRIPLL